MSSDVQLTVTVVGDITGYKMLIGFHNDTFSQAVYLPDTDNLDAVIEQFHQSLVDSLNEIRRAQIGLILPKG